METKPQDRYHHGALREALLAAAEKLLLERGVGGLTLRGIARAAGVSHGAPAHHFDDLSDLLSELAAVGFSRLVDRLEAAVATRGTVRFPVAKAYVRFALDNPALFSLMFRDERLNPKCRSLREMRIAAIAALSRMAGASDDSPGLQELGVALAGWSLAHGFSVLAIDGRLTPLLRRGPAGTDLDGLLEAALAAADLQGWSAQPSGISVTSLSSTDRASRRPGSGKKDQSRARRKAAMTPTLTSGQ